MGVVAIDDSEAGHAVGCGHCGTIILVPQSRVSPGAIIDDFVLEKEIGEGGLATVYLAHQMSLDRPAAVKILREQYASNRAFIADFLKEARSAAQLNHPNIVQAFAVGEDEGIHFFAMEYVQGTSLKDVLTHSGRLVPERALDIISVIAQALAFAWDKKELVHLDVKPDNIILTDSGETKLADLGLARIGADIREESETTEVFGTPQYISPELLTGSHTDNRTDVYSLGATLYHAVTGQYPFTGQTASEIARRHITEPLKPARKISGDVPQDVSDLIDIMMAKRPGHRWQSAAEVVAEIERIKAGKPISRRPVKGLQKPLDLENLEDELAATLEDLESTAAESGKRKINVKKGGVKLKTGGSAISVRPKKTGAKAKADKSVERKKPGAKPTDTPDAKEGAPVTTKPAVRKRRKKKSPAAMLAVLGAFALLLVVAGVIAIVVVRKHQDRKRLREEIERMGLSSRQHEELAAFREKVEAGVEGEALLKIADELLDRHSGAEALRGFVIAELGRAREDEIRRIREELRRKELEQWRARSRELIAEERRRRLEADEQRRRREEELERQREEQRRREQREALIAELRGKMDEKRKRSAELCRQLNFPAAKLQFAEFIDAPDEELRDWAAAKQDAVELASRAFDLVREGEDFLKGERFSVKGKPQRVVLKDIGVTGISAELREPKYDKGTYIGDRVELLTVPFDELRSSQFVKLAETAGRKRGIDEARLNLMLGAYLLARQDELLQEARRFLSATTLTDRAAPLLEELEEFD